MLSNTRKLSRLNLKQLRVTEKLDRIFSFRLMTGGSAVSILAALSLGARSPWLVVALLIIALVFLRLLSITRRIRRFSTRLHALHDFYDRQNRRVRGEPPVTRQPRITSNEMAADLDFFGPHSLLSQIDETVTDDGRALLARTMMNPPLEAAQIAATQRAVANLSAHAGRLRRLIVIAASDLESRPTPFSNSLLEQSLVDGGFARRHAVLWVLFLAYAVAAAAGISGLADAPIGAFWFAYFMFSMFSLGKAADAFTRIQAIGLDGERLAPIFSFLESLSQTLRERYLPKLNSNPLSKSLAQVDRLTSLLSVQTHPLVAVLVNGFVPWSYFFAARAERLRLEVARHWPPLMTELNEFEIVTSLALIYRYQTQVFPKFGRPGRLSVRAIRHPLIVAEKSVANDFDLPSERRLVLITGSNMSGKSTFLRTLGVNQTLALMGAPVFAGSMETPLARPLTCIRVSDSVRDGVSYFYAETLRLKSLLEQADDSTLYLIDEMFRGTNNRERLIGSRAVVAALIQRQGIGFVTTHDLELTALESTNAQLTNWHFADDLDSSGLRFSYMIHSGPCPTTNALKIMKSLGLPIDG